MVFVCFGIYMARSSDGNVTLTTYTSYTQHPQMANLYGVGWVGEPQKLFVSWYFKTRVWHKPRGWTGRNVSSIVCMYHMYTAVTVRVHLVGCAFITLCISVLYVVCFNWNVSYATWWNQSLLYPNPNHSVRGHVCTSNPSTPARILVYNQIPHSVGMMNQ